MKIVIYSANSSFSDKTIYDKEYPSRSEIWDEIAKKI